MSKKKKLVPFSWLPASWGLTGTTRKIAEAEYYYEEGYELDLVLADIHNENPNERNIAVINVQLKHNKITQYDYDIELAKLTNEKENKKAANELQLLLKEENVNHEDSQKKLIELKSIYEDKLAASLLDIELLYGKISKIEYDKKLAEITGAPWVSIPKINWDPNNDKQTYFELDYNPAFIEDLRMNGYLGSEEEIIDQWLNDVCGSIANEMNEEITTSFVSNRKKRNDGLTEHT